jgi:hypothetical protein
VWAYDRGVKQTLDEQKVADEYAFVKLECVCDNSSKFYIDITVSDSGVKFAVSSQDEVGIAFPVFVSDGQNNTNIVVDQNAVSVDYKGYVCTCSASSAIIDSGEICANRNGHYKAMTVNGKNSVDLEFSINQKS